MIYAVISDIHGNLEALLATLESIKSYKKNIDKIICLGDIVGYGADPNECIRITREVSDVILAGNHDFAVCEQTSIENFNYYAKAAVLWSRDALNKEEIDFLKGLPLKYQEKGTDYVHASLHRPESWRYLSGTFDTQIDFQIMEQKILFVGHTHVPVIFENTEMEIKRINGPEFSLNSDKKYIINPGSVGQPRDRDPRASFSIFDLEKNFIETIRVEYDIKKAQRKILDAGLPEVLATRLSYGG
ncbi:metallophosphoesterase family protein [candidate division WOR-3 bacterium]|nr:metallophosphoesterase family protein [candidate division WOR-3 bacterium]